MTTKLRIDLSQGLLEVEGSEAFVRNIYADFKTHFAGIEVAEVTTKPTRRSRKTKAAVSETTASKNDKEPDKVEQPDSTLRQAPAVEPLKATAQPAKPAEPTATTNLKPVTATGYTYIDSLELKAAKNRPALVEYMDSKFPITNEERNIVFLYYLQYLLKVKPITVDHVYTCYREAKIRAPLNIQNSLDHDGWVKIAKNGNITLTPAGKKYVEQQLPKKLKY